MIWTFEVIVAVIGSLGAAGIVLWQLGDPSRRIKQIQEHNDDTGTIVEDMRQTRKEDD